MAAVDWRGALLERVQPRPRRWDSPGAMALELEPSTKQTRALHVIDTALVQLRDGALPGGDGSHLLLAMSPQEGKSQRTSRWNPTWLLYDDPTLRIGIISYSLDKAMRWGKATRRDVLANPVLAERIRIRADSRSAEHWETEQGGGIVCAGIEGGITGEPLDYLVIDDPVRGRAEAESSTYRENAWDIWESNLSTRASAKFRAVVMMTRWHEDDLHGRLRANEPGVWHEITIPAIADSPNDPLGRAVGEEMDSARGRAGGYFHQLQARRSPYVFASMFQQRPVPAEGGLFPRQAFRYWAKATAPAPSGADQYDLRGHRTVSRQDVWTFITVDLAASKRTSADWTVASVWGVTTDDHLMLLDRGRSRVDETQHINLVEPLARRWDASWVGVEDAKQAMTLAHDLGKAGITVRRMDPMGGDKTVKAIAASNRAKQGRIWLPADATWLDEFLDEAASFPNGAHDDQVDTMSYAALALMGAPGATAIGLNAPTRTADHVRDGAAGLELPAFHDTVTDWDNAIF